MQVIENKEECRVPETFGKGGNQKIRKLVIKRRDYSRRAFITSLFGARCDIFFADGHGRKFNSDDCCGPG